MAAINVDQHGSSPVTLTCELGDVGSLSIRSTLIDALLGFGISGFPRAIVTRRAPSSTDTAVGCVGLTNFSVASQALKVSGHTPCKRPADCPAGQTCDVPKETCR